MKLIIALEKVYKQYEQPHPKSSVASVNQELQNICGQETSTKQDHRSQRRIVYVLPNHSNLSSIRGLSRFDLFGSDSKNNPIQQCSEIGSQAHFLHQRIS